VPIIQETANPFKAGQIDSAWSYCAHFAVDWETGVIRLVYLTYADRDSAYADFPPTRRVEITIQGDEFAGLRAAHAELFEAVRAAVDAYALTQPDFAGGAIEDQDAPI